MSRILCGRLRKLSSSQEHARASAVANLATKWLIAIRSSLASGVVGAKEAQVQYRLRLSMQGNTAWNDGPRFGGSSSLSGGNSAFNLTSRSISPITVLQCSRMACNLRDVSECWRILQAPVPTEGVYFDRSGVSGVCN
jgi:hypothetical protein